MIQAFNQIRLTNNIINASGGNLSVGGQTVVYQSQTGNFITTSQTGNFGAGATGQLTGAFYPLNSNPSGYVQSTQTGSFITTTQSGQFASTANLASTGAIFATYTGKIQNFTTSITPTGQDTYNISFPVAFASIPKIQLTVEVSGNVLYGVAFSNRTTSGFNALFTDYIAENGVVLHTTATIN